MQRTVHPALKRLHTACAAGTASLLTLRPMAIAARSHYLLEVLRQRYEFTGDASGLPLPLVQCISDYAAGVPKDIELLLDALAAADAFRLEEDGGAGMVVRCGTLAELKAVPPPARMKANLLQQFDSLPMALQRLLKTVTPSATTSCAAPVPVHPGLRAPLKPRPAPPHTVLHSQCIRCSGPRASEAPCAAEIAASVRASSHCTACAPQVTPLVAFSEGILDALPLPAEVRSAPPAQREHQGMSPCAHSRTAVGRAHAHLT